ncbi:hypothetical protein [Saccharicrinis sp. GN24d3]|uniref:hypothetical protein n=1 Tax=Saccharicrinis sp. GN24d3 TaxID=3458416 RepID=UPI0040369E73
MQIELVNIFQGLLILTGLVLVLCFTSNILRVILMTYWYPLLPMLLFCIRIPVGGSLDVIGRPVHQSYCDEALLYALGSFYVFVLFIWKLRREKVSMTTVNVSDNSRLLLCVILFVVAIIAYPRAFGVSDKRWNLLPGQWSVIYLVVNTLLILSLKKIKSISYFIHIGVLIITIKGGERVDSLMVLFLLASFQYDRESNLLKEIKLNRVKKIGMLAVIILGISVGYLRGGSTFNVYLLLHNLIAMHTVTDVIHIYFSSFDYVNTYGVNALPVVNQVFSLIPMHPWGGAGKVYNFTEILRNHIPNLGGGIFYSEGHLLLGRMGILMYGFIYALFVKVVIKYKNQYTASLMVLFIVLQLRIQWYGTVYYYTPVIVTILSIGVLNLVSKNKIKISET